MKNQAEVMYELYNWLNGLGIGPVFQDRKPFGDTTKQRSSRTYIVFQVPDGIEDQNAYFRGVCNVCIGCRDKEKFKADMQTLDDACKKFLEQFDMNNEETGLHCHDVEQVDFYSDDIGNHEYLFVFDVFADKT